jgi:hypothetical protein
MTPFKASSQRDNPSMTAQHHFPQIKRSLEYVTVRPVRDLLKFAHCLQALK